LIDVVISMFTINLGIETITPCLANYIWGLGNIDKPPWPPIWHIPSDHAKVYNVMETNVLVTQGLGYSHFCNSPSINHMPKCTLTHPKQIYWNN